MNLLLSTPLSSMFIVEPGLQPVRDSLATNHIHIPRKSHALLGQSILHSNLTIQHVDTMVLAKPGLFEPSKFWDIMDYLTNDLLRNNIQLLSTLMIFMTRTMWMLLTLTKKITSHSMIGAPLMKMNEDHSVVQDITRSERRFFV